MAYNDGMVIKETHLFTKIIREIMPDNEYMKLQEALIRHPKSGDVIKGSGGLRKLRWKLPGRGKSGGVRIIYYNLDENSQIYMIYVYKKNEQENLTKEQLKQLRHIIEEELM